ncbi:hypothetical protein HK102_012756 [Quaeritorhiza haematococci]|nr:hypothetical protein HK102_012756 [Quaeritorhiza haematococci]
MDRRDIQQFFDLAIVPYQSMLVDYVEATKDVPNTLIFAIILSNKGYLLTHAQVLHRAVIDQISHATGKSYGNVFTDVMSHASTFQMVTSLAKQIQNIDDIIQQNLIPCLSLQEFERTFLSGQAVSSGDAVKLSRHRWEENGLDVAVKTFTQQSFGNGERAAVSYEAEYFYLFRLSGIAHFLNVFASDRADDKRKVQVTFAIILKIVYGILCAGATLASLGILHGNINPKTFVENKYFNVKLTDFANPTKYAAPESHSTQASHEWDCYSTGKRLNDLLFFHPCMEHLRDTHLQEIGHIINKLTYQGAGLRISCEEAISALVESFLRHGRDRSGSERGRQPTDHHPENWTVYSEAKANTGCA